MSSIPPESQTFNEAYHSMVSSIRNFYRYATRHPGTVSSELYDEEYYRRTVELVKEILDHEMNYLHSPHLD